MNPETKIENKACKLVFQLLGIKGSKLRVPGDDGYPDRIFWCPGGQALLVEFKQPGREPEPKQIEIHNELRALGYRVEVCDDPYDTVEKVIDFLETTPISKNCSKILARTRRRCTVLRSRSRQD